MSILRAAQAATVALTLGAAAFGFGAAAAAQPASDAHAGRIVLPADVTPDHYDISIKPDAAALTFTGKVRIELTVHQPTDRIVLNDADIVIDHAALSGEAAAPSIAYDPKVQTATFGFGHMLRPGRYSLALDYHGRIYQQASGFFALDYQTPAGTKRALFTQFENSDARRFTPSWDEPGRKATFTLTAIVPTGQMALSNMPVARTTPLGGGLQEVRFAQTPRMSSYLLFFGLGDFERVSRNVGGVDVGVVVKRGDTASAGFALDAASQILPYYNSYFGKPYPLPKMDLIAGPGSSEFFGAMENWGAIFYFERDLLVDPRVSTQGDRQNVYVTVAHEMAHQWFGDLVTMSWWDDLWLNEGFASWMENKVTDHFHPEWNMWLQNQGSTQYAMQTDARDGTHPIITPINDVLQAGGAFDEITYQKGAAVIRMLESYVGEDTFRAGVRRYIAAHAYGNTVTDDLWREIDAVSPGRPITQIAHDFTLQAGVPLVSETAARCEGGRERLDLSQGRFATDDTGKAPTVWRVPVTAAVVGGAQGQAVVAAPAGGRLDLAGCGPALLNLGQAGYFRTLYAAQPMAELTERFASLSPDDQLGLLNDARALAYAGYEPIPVYLNLTRRVDAGADPIVWQGVAGSLAGLDRLYDGRPGQAAYQAYARGVLQPALARVGWDAKPGESDNVALMRSAVLSALGRLGDPAVAAEAHRRFEAFVRDPSSLNASTRRTVLDIVAQHADAADWEQLHGLAVSARTELERVELYARLGEAEDPALARRALDLSLSGEPAATTTPQMVEAVSSRHPAMALDFTAAHWDRISALLEPDTRATFPPRLVMGGSDKALADKMDAFAAANIPESARQDVRKADANIAYLAKVKAERLPDVDRWLAQAR
ncbi:MAG: M1 family aminopeptidase [Caulobacteraceae bacterium]|nr:M1 family aminopeptidase [Caulobacteraceae bacterium]